MDNGRMASASSCSSHYDNVESAAAGVLEAAGSSQPATVSTSLTIIIVDGQFETPRSI
jgi:hypothetical protein